MKSAQDMRQIVSDELDALKEGKTTVQKAQTIANLVGKYLHSIRLQLEYVRLKQSLGNTLDIPALDSRKP